jgi:hypothetical protein
VRKERSMTARRFRSGLVSEIAHQGRFFGLAFEVLWDVGVERVHGVEDRVDERSPIAIRVGSQLAGWRDAEGAEIFLWVADEQG